MLLQLHNSRVCRKKHKNITYDANGALLTDGLRHYAYDSEGRLAAASLGWSSAATTDDNITKYAHNSQAQRVFKTAPLYAVTNPEPTATPDVLALFTTFFESLWAPSTNPDGSTVQKAGMSYVYDEDGTLIAQTLTGGAQTSWGQSARYVYLPTASGPMPVVAIYGTKHYAIQSDHLNTPRRLIQSDGQVAWQWAYSAFGDEKPTIAKTRFANVELNQSFGSTTVPAVTFNLRYPGQYFDQESGLHYNVNRSLDTKVGRYTQADPIDLQGGWNRFSYVGQNPLSFTDPLGLAWSCKTVGLFITCTNTPPWNPDLPPGYNPPKPGFTWPNWMGSRSAGKGEEARPPDVNPGKDCNGQCMPCPKNPPSFNHDGDAHGTDRGFHTHQWQYHQAPDCTCRARKVSW